VAQYAVASTVSGKREGGKMRERQQRGRREQGEREDRRRREEGGENYCHGLVYCHDVEFGRFDKVLMEICSRNAA
jgi:hypothetical protein